MADVGSNGDQGPATLECVIGFRAFSDGFAYVVLGGTQAAPEPVANDYLAFPENETWSRRLAWLRRELIEILERHSVVAAALKAIERNAQRVSRERLQGEAIIQEVLQSRFHIECHSRVKAQIRTAIPGFKEPARYVDRVLDGSEALEQLKSPRFQEATLAALSALPEGA